MRNTDPSHDSALNERAWNAASPADRSPERKTSDGAWARYWRTGALHSCVGSFEGNYGGSIGEFWRSRFQTLAPAARVLDVATGNGAVPRLLVASRDDVECDAVDAAIIAPTWWRDLSDSQRSRLRFHGSTAAERLPFPENHFDLVTSQYGLEYTDMSRSAIELRRVAKRSAELAIVAHHTQSRPVAMGRDELQHIGWLLGAGGLLETAGELLEPFQRARSAAGRRALARDAKAIAQREHFNALQRELTDRSVGATCPDVLHEARQALADVLAQASHEGAAAGGQSLGALRSSLQDNAIRLTDLVRCALDAAGVAVLLSDLGASAHSVVDTLRDSGHLMGWCIAARLEPAHPVPR